jgi:hypothetical protein
MRANEGLGGWAEQSDQQKKFRPFGLDSYQKGKLDFSILPRPLVPPTRTEQAEERQKVWQAIKIEGEVIGSTEFILETEEGWDAERLKKLKDYKEEAAQRQQEMFERQQQQATANAAGQQQTGQRNESQNQRQQANRATQNNGVQAAQ